jgi:hypothetical protein
VVVGVCERERCIESCRLHAWYRYCDFHSIPGCVRTALQSPTDNTPERKHHRIHLDLQHLIRVYQSRIGVYRLSTVTVSKRLIKWVNSFYLQFGLPPQDVPMVHLVLRHSAARNEDRSLSVQAIVARDRHSR